LAGGGVTEHQVRVAVVVKVSYGSRSNARCGARRGSRSGCGCGCWC
jgi:hypothetical protein